MTQGAEKNFVSYMWWYPYRKPTLVDEERILRRTGQYSFRNSAKKRPYLRYKAFPPFWCKPKERDEAKDPSRLFIKNTGPC